MEVGQGQHEVIAGLLCSLFPTAKIDVAPDLGGIQRVVSMELSAAVTPRYVK